MSWRENLGIGVLTRGNKEIEVPAYDVQMTVGAEAADAIDVAVQLNDHDGVALKKVGVVDFYLSTDALGATPAGTAPTGGTAAGAAGAIIESVADLSGKLISDATGLVNVVLTDVGTPTFYLVIVPPTGDPIISSAITFA